MQNKERFRLEKFEWSKFWYVTFSEGRRSKRISTRQTDRGEAEKFKAAFVLEFDKEQRTDTLLTVNDALDYYMLEHSPKTASHYNNGFAVPILRKHFGDLIAMEVDVLHANKFVGKMAEAGYSNGYIRKLLTVLQSSLNHCKTTRRITSVNKIPFPAAPPAKKRWLSPKEYDSLENAATGHLKLYIMLAVYTGQRRGAILDLTWDQVDFENGLIDFNPPGRAQTKKRRATVPMNDRLYQVMEETHKEAEKKRIQHVVSCKGIERIKSIKTGFKAACEKAGLKEVTPHTLRHTAGTWMAMAGVDMWRISGILGHSHSRTTELYAKHHPDFMRDAVAKIEDIRSGASARKLRTNSGKSGKTDRKAAKGA